MMLEISRAVLDVIRAETAASPNVEVCGLLLGKGLCVVEARPCRNVADDPATTFEIDPRQLIATHRAARNSGPQVIGHYHSHPNGKAEPSARDAAAAHGGEVWMIVTQDEESAWLARNGQRFDRLALNPTPAKAGAQ